MTLHFVNKDTDFNPICGVKSLLAEITGMESLVSCKRCLKVMIATCG